MECGWSNDEAISCRTRATPSWTSPAGSPIGTAGCLGVAPRTRGQGPGPTVGCGAVYHQQHHRHRRGLARFQHTPSKGRVKKKEPGAKSPFHNYSLTSRSRNENTLMRFVSSNKFGTSRVSTNKSIYFRCRLAKQPHIQLKGP